MLPLKITRVAADKPFCPAKVVKGGGESIISLLPQRRRDQRPNTVILVRKRGRGAKERSEYQEDCSRSHALNPLPSAHPIASLRYCLMHWRGPQRLTTSILPTIHARSNPRRDVLSHQWQRERDEPRQQQERSHVKSPV